MKQYFFSSEPLDFLPPNVIGKGSVTVISESLEDAKVLLESALSSNPYVINLDTVSDLVSGQTFENAVKSMKITDLIEMPQLGVDKS